jgi:hypothetical protein
MFIKASLNPVQLFSGNHYYNILNVDNLSRVSHRKITRLDKSTRDKTGWSNHKRKVLWGWVNTHFAISELFIHKLEKYIEKLNIVTSPREQEFIFSIKALFFATWRPLKEMIVRFALEKKEVVYFFESNGNIYETGVDENNKTVNTHVVSGDFYFSNSFIRVCDEDQKIKMVIDLNLISEVEFSQFGTIIYYEGKKLLLRSENKYMAYIILQRILPKLKLNINKIPHLYNYFDFWNKVLMKIN